MPAETGRGSLEKANFRRPQDTITEPTTNAGGQEKQLFSTEKTELGNQEQTIDQVATWQEKLHEVLANDADKGQNLSRSEEQLLLDYQQKAAARLGNLAILSRKEVYPQLAQANDLLKQIAQLKVKEMFTDNRVKNAQNTIIDLNDLLQQLNLSPLTAETKSNHSQQLASLIEQYSLKVNELKNHTSAYKQQEMTLFSQLENLRPQLNQAGFNLENDTITPFIKHSRKDQQASANASVEKNQQASFINEQSPTSSAATLTEAEQTVATPPPSEVILPNQVTAEIANPTNESENESDKEAATAEIANPTNESESNKEAPTAENLSPLAQTQEQLLSALSQLEATVNEQLSQAQEQYTQEINLQRAKKIIDYRKQLKHGEIMMTYLDSLIELAKANYPQLKSELLLQLAPQEQNPTIKLLLDAIALYSQQEDITPTELRNVKFDFQRKNEEVTHLLALNEKLQTQAQESEGLAELSQQIESEKTTLKEEKAATLQSVEQLQAASDMLEQSESKFPTNESEISWLKKAREFLLVNPLASLKNLFSGEVSRQETSAAKKTATTETADLSSLSELPLHPDNFAAENQEFVTRFNQEIAQGLEDCRFWLETLPKGETLARRQWSEQMMSDRQELKRTQKGDNQQESQYYTDVPHYNQRQRLLGEKFTHIQHDYARLSRLQRELDYWQNRQNEANDFKKNLNNFFTQVNQWQLPNNADQHKFTSILSRNYLLLANGFSQIDIEKKISELKADLEWQEQDLLKNEKQLARYEDSAKNYQYLPALQKYDWQSRENQFKYEQSLNSWNNKNVRERLLAEHSAKQLPELELVRSRENSYWQVQELLLNLQYLDWQLANAQEFLQNEQVVQLQQTEDDDSKQLLIDKARHKFAQISQRQQELLAEKQAALERLDQAMAHLSQLQEQAEQQAIAPRKELANLLADYQQLDYAQLLTKLQEDRRQVPTLGKAVDAQAA